MSQVTDSILFRQRLYQNFKQSGLLSQLKTTLRTSLLQKLQKPQQSPTQNLQKAEQQKKKPLYLRDKFLACIVRQYLIKSQKQYTLSILMPESNLDQEDGLNFHELAQITNMNATENDSKSYLESLVEEWMKIRSTDICERSTQTDYAQPVSKKFEDIQKKYISRIDYWKLVPNAQKTLEKSASNVSIMAKEQRMKEQMQQYKKRIGKEIQLSVKAEMEKKYSQQYQFRTHQLQKNYETRLTELKNRQKTILESLQRKTKDVEDKARKISDDELKMIKKYQDRIVQLEMQHKRKLKQIDNREQEYWKRELQIKAKKRQYEDSIRALKQKVVDQTLNI